MVAPKPAVHDPGVKNGGTAMLRVLAATDLSPNADIALSRAISLAAENGASLRVVHVPESRQSEEQRAAVRQRLAAQVKAGGPPDLQVDVALLFGDPVDAILEDALTFAPDLIVLGGHRRMRLRDALFGTTATQFLGRTRVPLLVARKAGDFPYARILAALDATEAGEQVLRLAMRLASARDVFAVHAFQIAADVHVQVDGGIAGIERQHRRAIEEIVREVAGSIASVQVHVDVEQGDTFRVIEEAVKQIEPNLLIFGTHGRRGIDRILFDSLAEDALAYFDLDILVVRADEIEILEQGPAATAVASDRA
jgi:nucleotide-binding universal stress UspA family protein